MQIKSLRYLLLPICISILLLVAPFFWLKPGEMDLGGDSGRLYFYDPLSYLKTQIVYGVTTSGTGGEAVSYFVIPFIFLLVVLKSIFNSPTILISLFNGIKLSVSFITCYLILKELLDIHKLRISKFAIESSAIVAALFYIITPTMIYTGWERAILSHMQLFINPLMFLLILKYVTTRKTWYLITSLIVSFIFSSNFSYFAAPPFFAFYPLSMLFLALYVKYIKKSSLPIRSLVIGGIVFFLLQAFHLGPHIMSLFTSGSELYESVFSESTRLTHGLDYFTGTASGVRVSLNLLGLAQMREVSLVSFGYIIFPLILIIGLFKSKSRLIFLSAIFFLITLFFVSANITNIGFTFYRLLFYIPGFKMFRNFYGQWAFVYMFFYSLFFGQSLAFLIHTIRKHYAYLLLGFICFLLGYSSMPLLNGSIVNSINHLSKNIKQVIRMDPTFEKVLGYIRSIPIEGKILSLPLAGPGYQLFAGKDGGAYMGSSTFSYLTGKNDFTGYTGLTPYGDIFLKLIIDKNYSSLQRLLSLLNIRYIFYNSDPYIYDDNFPQYPYDYIREHLPSTQEGYKELLPFFPINTSTEVRFGENYHLYSVNDDTYIPRIYPTTTSIFATNPNSLLLDKELNNNSRNAIFPISHADAESKDVILEAEQDDKYTSVANNLHLHRHDPYVTVSVSDIQYPLVLIKEKIDLLRASKDHQRFFDYHFFLLTKRVAELNRWGDEIPITKQPQNPPKIWDVFKKNRYNSWESSLARYEATAKNIIQWMIDSSSENVPLDRDKIAAKEQFDQHRRSLLGILKNNQKSEGENVYLRQTIEEMFDRLYTVLDIKIYDPNTVDYILRIPDSLRGSYDVYVKSADSSDTLYSPLDLKIDTINLSSKIIKSPTHMIQIDSVFLESDSNKKISLHRNPINLAQFDNWINSGYVKIDSGIQSLFISNISNEYSDGLISEISNWKPSRQYMITFDYNTYGNYVLYRMFDKQLLNKKTQKLRTNIFFEKNLHSTTWKTQQSFISSNASSYSAFLQFLNESRNISSQIDIKNLSIIEINPPKLFFRKRLPEGPTMPTDPTITFQKINPTKYIIQVSDVHNPYVLVFLEAFGNHWKLIDINKKDKSLSGMLMNYLGNAAQRIARFIYSTPVDDTIISASYFDGKVREGNNIFSISDMRNFISWGKMSVTNRRHYRTNHYANGWIINPSDLDNRTSYTLVLEMETQNYFYLFFAMSVATFFGITGYLIILLLKRKA